MLDYSVENKQHALGAKVICGVDEAGRGCLCGSVYAAAVILPDGYTHPKLNDSKKLTASMRDKLYDDIVANAVAYSVAFADVDEIESLNILNAAMLAMRRAVSSLDVTPDLALIDGNVSRGFEIPTLTLVGGDGISPSIAAASILAKVSRDRYITELASRYPKYGFEKHKGYGTREHYSALREYGPCEIHRPSFLKKL